MKDNKTVDVLVVVAASTMVPSADASPVSGQGSSVMFYKSNDPNF